MITTVAGTDFAFPATPLAAINAPNGTVAAVATDIYGNVYFTESDIGNNLVFKVTPQGVLTVVAGNGTNGFSGDGGPATSAALDSPIGVTVDSFGNVFFADSFNNRIRKVTAGGIISTYAGNGTVGYSGDGGLAINAALNMSGNGYLAVDLAGNLYIADQGNNVIRKVTPAGIISTYAGNGSKGLSGNGGQATNAALNLNGYGAVAVDASGDLFIADEGNNQIRKVTAGGVISTVAGTGVAGFSGDGGLATSATMYAPDAIAVDSTGNLFFADSFNDRVREVTTGGVIVTVAGTGKEGYTGDGGLATKATISLVTGVAVDSSGNLYFADSANKRIRKVNAAGIISTFVGDGLFRYQGDGGTAASAAVSFPDGAAVDASGNLFFADSFNHRIRKVTPAGIISTVAGNGTGGFSGDGGLATEASLLFPFGVAVDASGDLFIADSDNSRVRKVTPDGIINTVAGINAFGYSGDGGPATSAALNLPIGLAVDAGGNLFIADNKNNRIRKVSPDGFITTEAGGPKFGNTGDGGPAIDATLNLPTGVAVDAAGNLYIADSGNSRVRKVTPSGIISGVAGNGTFGYSGDGGPAIDATLDLNWAAAYDSIAVDAAGNLFIADYFNNLVRKVTPEGIINTVAGDGFHGYFGDGGLATHAELSYPSTVAVDASGNLFITDVFNNRIREVLATPPTVSVSAQQLSFTAASGGAPTAAQTLSLTSSVEGLAFSLDVTANISWLDLTPVSGSAPRLIQVIADPTGLAPMTYHATLTVVTPYANPELTTIAVTFTVTAPVPPALSIDKASLSFPYPQQGSARSQTITVSNSGGGTLPFTAAATTTSGGSWLSVSPTGAQALPGTPATLTVTANPAGLSAGTYVGLVTVTAGGKSQSVPVTMTVSSLNQAILLSQSGLSFLAVQGGGVVPAQSFGVQNIGTGSVNWTASTSTLAGGLSWLQVTPNAGSSVAGSPSPRVTVSVNGAALPAGTYYGLVRVNAPGAANSPQVVTVFLQVLPAGSNVAGVVQPAQLVFTATAGGESPGSQNVQVYNIVAGAKTFRSQVTADFGLGLVTLPRDATLDPQVPTNIVVQPITTGLSAGVYFGVLTLQFSDGSVSAVKITVIVSNNAGATPASKNEARPGRPADSGSCSPSKLLPALTTLGQTFTVSAGWPAALIVNVADDCGMPMPPSGSVIVNFSDGEPSLTLASQGGGSWENTWSTGNSATAGVTLTIQAANQGLTGNEVVNGSLASQQQPPLFAQSGLTSVAIISSFSALAPGSAISIYGTRLAESTASATTLPLPIELVDTQVFVAGTSSGGGAPAQLINLPLYYVSENQINAVVPYEVNVNTTLQLLVQRGTTYSVPVQIDMASAQPAFFSTSGLPGGAGVIVDYPASGTAAYVVNTGAPAHAGDTIVLYCTGLGAVNPVVGDGAAPGQQLSQTIGTAQLMVGGQSAHVSFAGLAPGFAGLYQVNATVPKGVQTGGSVPVTVTIDGQTSPLITIAIK